MDALCNCQGFHLSRIFLLLLILCFLAVFFYNENLCADKLRIFSFQKGCSRIQSIIVIISDSSKILSHDLTEYIVDRIQYLCTASEIFVQVDSLFLAVFQRITMIFLHKKLRPCQTKTVDALLDITYHKNIFAL